MKVVTETRTMPAEEYTVTTYGCDECEFTAQDEDDVRAHHAKTHACRAKLTVDHCSMYRFTGEDDAKAWLDEEFGDFYSQRGVVWNGPGWYIPETSTEPCPRGCCTDHCVSLRSVDSWTGDLVYRARAIMRRFTAIRAAVKEAGDG